MDVNINIYYFEVYDMVRNVAYDNTDPTGSAKGSSTPYSSTESAVLYYIMCNTAVEEQRGQQEKEPMQEVGRVICVPCMEDTLLQQSNNNNVQQ